MITQTWHRDKILETLRVLHKQGRDLSYNAMARRNQALVSAANYHYKSYRHAVLMAGIDYALIRKKPTWTEAKIVSVIRKAYTAGMDLSWRSVYERRDLLGRAGAAAVHKHLFGSWPAALRAAKLNPRTVARYRRWTRDGIVRELQTRSKRRWAVNAGVIQRTLPGLYGSAVRLFGSYNRALRAAGIDPTRIVQRRDWNRSKVLVALRDFAGRHEGVSRSLLRQQDSGLMRAMLLHFGTIHRAAGIAGVNVVRAPTKRAREKVG